MSPQDGPRQVVVGLGAGASGFSADGRGYERGGGGPGSDLATTDMVLNVGPQHPATHGVLRLRLTLDGERIVRLRADRRATCTAGWRSCSRYATTDRSSSWPTGTTG
ncbi:MAG: hypothetical protein WKF83_15650 [Nocardioidaceae bacterium]